MRTGESRPGDSVPRRPLLKGRMSLENPYAKESIDICVYTVAHPGAQTPDGRGYKIYTIWQYFIPL